MQPEERMNCEKWLREVKAKLEKKMPYAIEKAQGLDGIPYTTKEAEWRPGPFDDICWWTNGFWSGAMWQMYLLTGDEQYAREAQRGEELLDAAFLDHPHLHHDVGFMWRLSAAAQYDLVGCQRSYDRAMQAANLLAGRYNPLGFIRAWNEDRAGWAIIDCMMNLSLLFWASERSGDPRFRMIAARHADTAMKHFVRPDGSCEHIVIFDPETMQVVDKPGGQGYGPGSAWSRGQGWAMYGFIIAYRYTGNAAYLETARRVSDFFLSSVGEDGIPASDFRGENTTTRKDNVAGALAACALIDLSRTIGGEDGERYLAEALRLLMSMETVDADWALGSPAIFRRCRAAYHSESHQTMQYGDYFFIEAVGKLLGLKYPMW